MSFYFHEMNQQPKNTLFHSSLHSTILTLAVRSDSHQNNNKTSTYSLSELNILLSLPDRIELNRKLNLAKGK